MRVALVFPPSLCYPNQLYYALPVLAGALARAGHEPQITDLNLLAADRFLTEEWTRHGFRLACDEVVRRFLARDRPAADRLTRNLDAFERALAAGPASKALLRDPVRAYDQEAFRDAFWNVVDCLSFFHQLDPVYSPHRPTFARDLERYQQVDPWTPLQDLYEAHLVDAVLARRPEMVAISVAFPEQAAESVRLARRLRARAPDLHLCFGGALIGRHRDRWLEDGFLLRYADSVCIGEGEETIVALADALERGGDLARVPHLATRDARGRVRQPDGPPHLERMEDQPVPHFDSADLTLGFTPEPIYTFMVARGCYWGRCTFCSLGWREHYRPSAMETLRRGVRELARQGARYVQLQDASVPPSGARMLAQIVEEEGLDLTWVSGMKFESCLLDRAYCEQLARGGCRSLLIGFVTANQRLLDLMDKGYRLEDAPRMLENLRAAGISAELLWFVGFPTETRAEALATIEFLTAHRQLYGHAAFVSEYQLHPETIVYDDPARFGVTILGERNGTCTYTTETGMTMEELAYLEARLAPTNNRTLVCNGSHLPHLSQRGVELRGLARPLDVPEDVLAFCRDPSRPVPGAFRAAPTAKLVEPPDDVEPRLAPPPPRRGFLDEDFGFRAKLEDAWRDVLAEWDALPKDLVRAWPQVGAVAGVWGIYGFWMARRRIDANCARCPRTAALLDAIPGIYTAGFSVLGPGSDLPLHYGEALHVLRAHLALVVPPACGIRVGCETRTWTPGRTLAFEDVLLHRAWNHGGDHTVILLLDFERPHDQLPAGYDLEAWRAKDARFYAALFPDWVSDVARVPDTL